MMKNTLPQISQTRSEILKVSQQLSVHISQLLRINKITKGSIYIRKGKCGHSNCKCARGELHNTKTFTQSFQGKTKLINLTKYPMPDLNKLENQLKYYQRFRRLRSKIATDYQVLVKAIRLLEKNISIDVTQLLKTKGTRHGKRTSRKH